MEAISCSNISLPVPLLGFYVQPSFQTFKLEYMLKIGHDNIMTVEFENSYLLLGPFFLAVC